jgi:hypothetical protein
MSAATSDILWMSLALVGVCTLRYGVRLLSPVVDGRVLLDPNGFLLGNRDVSDVVWFIQEV